MKIFSAGQIKACDAYTVHASSITSLELMERAAGKCTEWLMQHMPGETLFVVLCGTGNNGGDGLAVARMLHQAGYGVKAFLLMFSDSLSADCSANLERLQKLDAGIITIMPNGTFISDIPENIVILDAILGTGLNKPAEGWLADFIDHINQLPNKKIAIDIPSGLPADTLPDTNTPILKADETLSFQFYKRTFLHAETGVFAGSVHILPIGLNETFIEGTGTQYYATSKEDIIAIYKPRNQFAHKGNFGSVLLAGGSYGKGGAITLSAKAALRAGAGLVTVLLPKCNYISLQATVPEAMCVTSGENEIDEIIKWKNKNTIGIGPGLGTANVTAKAFASFIDTYKAPLVIDADALNLIAEQPDLLSKIPAGSILTPHPKEFSRIFGESKNSIAQLEMARLQAMRYNIHIVLKGHHTAIVMPDGDCWYNLTGNAGMATGGSGDVLTGILTALLAQSYAGREAALLGVYLHGLAGDIAAEKLSQEALIASDIVDNLGAAFKSLTEQEQYTN